MNYSTIEIKETQTAVFPCSVDKDYDLFRFVWMDHHDEDIFKNSDKLADPNLHNRFKFIGNISDYNFTIELNDARISDTGRYKCVIYPNRVETDTYQIGTNLTVLPYPEITTATSNTNAQPEQQRQHQSHFHSPAASSSLEFNNNNSLDQADLLSSTSSSNSNSKQSLPQSRDTKTSPLYPSASTAYTSSSRFISSSNDNSLTSLRSNHHHSSGSSIYTLGSYGTLFGWPWLMLALAFILMLANVYLIYQLVQRHLRPSKEDQLSSDSSPAASTTSSNSNSNSSASSANSDQTGVILSGSNNGGADSSGHSTSSGSLHNNSLHNNSLHNNHNNNSTKQSPLNLTYVSPPTCVTSIASTINELNCSNANVIGVGGWPGSNLGIDELDTTTTHLDSSPGSYHWTTTTTHQDILAALPIDQTARGFCDSCDIFVNFYESMV